MAKVTLIAQPLISGHSHKVSLASLLASSWASEFVLSAAYVNAAGVDGVRSAMAAVGQKCRVFLGIRNGSSTCQGAMSLLKTGAKLFVVDTATTARIFHPKAYVAVGQTKALAIVGSANLTHAGLNNNIEVGTKLELDVSITEDKMFLDRLIAELDSLPVKFPANCYEITSSKQLVRLMHDGLLEDERTPRSTAAAPASKGAGKKGVKAIALPYVAPPVTKKKKKSAPSSKVAPPKIAPSFGSIVWQKPKLPRTDLQLNTQSAIPGVIRLTQAHFKVGGALIDHRTYFRTQVFGTLAWHVDPHDPGKQMSNALFALVIAGIYIGDFDLRLSYKPAWASGQGNYTTGLHVDKIMQFIRDPALVHRTLTLYAPPGPGMPYTIEIN